MHTNFIFQCLNYLSRVCEANEREILPTRDKTESISGLLSSVYYIDNDWVYTLKTILKDIIIERRMQGLSVRKLGSLGWLERCCNGQADVVS